MFLPLDTNKDPNCRLIHLSNVKKFRSDKLAQNRTVTLRTPCWNAIAMACTSASRQHHGALRRGNWQVFIRPMTTTRRQSITDRPPPWRTLDWSLICMPKTCQTLARLQCRLGIITERSGRVGRSNVHGTMQYCCWFQSCTAHDPTMHARSIHCEFSSETTFFRVMSLRNRHELFDRYGIKYTCNPSTASAVIAKHQFVVQVDWHTWPLTLWLRSTGLA